MIMLFVQLENSVKRYLGKALESGILKKNPDCASGYCLAEQEAETQALPRFRKTGSLLMLQH